MLINKKCLICSHDLKESEDLFWSCDFCNKKYKVRDGLISLVDNDKYWGEFSENEMDVILDKIDSKKYNDAKEYLARVLGRGGFVFGKKRSDFIYMLDLDKDKVYLDAGCGLGVHSFNLSRFAKQVYSFDLSIKRLRFCLARQENEAVNNITFFHSDFDSLPFKGDFFDGVIMNGVVEWLGEQSKFTNPRDDQLSVLRNIYKKLKKDGQLYIGIENRFAPAYLKGRDHSGLRYTNFIPRFLADWITKIKKGKPYRTYTYSIFGYKKLLKDAGFDIKKIEFYIGYPGYNLPKFIIPFDDLEALRFFLKNMTKSKGLKGKILRFLAKSNFCLKILRHGFFSYLIYARK